MAIKRLLMICWLSALGIALYSGCRVHRHKTYSFLDSQALRDVRSVAVLPFHNLSQKVNAGVIMANMLMVELIRHGKFRVIKYGDVRQFFLHRRMTSVATIDIKTLRELRQEFKVEAVIMGTVLRYEDGDDAGAEGAGRDKGPVYPAISISSTILDTRSGRILGQGEFMEKGSARGYLLSDKQRQAAFVLAQRLAQRLVSSISAEGDGA